jgi:16S rRNA (guanine(1405)-N(7))-methyltransferase
MGESKLPKKYMDMAPEAVERARRQAEGRYNTAKEADKALRRALRQMAGAFISPTEIKKARGYMDAFIAGDKRALAQALSLHASTRERLPSMDTLYCRIFDSCPRPDAILDLACGLNPLYLADAGFSVAGLDAHGGIVALLNEWARGCNWDLRASRADLLGDAPLPECGLALMFKLLPVLERQETGASVRLMQRVPARHMAVTFPTRTLGGRSAGMERHYSDWFERCCPCSHAIINRFTVADELCYIVERVN